MVIPKSVLLEARKGTSANYMLIQVGYSDHLVLPYKEGLKVVEALETAEQIINQYSDPAVVPLEKDFVKVTTISARNYQTFKIASLMGVPLSEVEKEMKERFRGVKDE